MDGASEGYRGRLVLGAPKDTSGMAPGMDGLPKRPAGQPSAGAGRAQAGGLSPSTWERTASLSLK